MHTMAFTHGGNLRSSLTHQPWRRVPASALRFEFETAPGIDEQRAIAAVLSDMDAELCVLEARRYKTRQLEQGTMQALLTGRIRLT